MKLLHLCAGNLYGGVESMLATLARESTACPELAHDFALCFASRLADELTALGCPPTILGHVRTSRPWTIGAVRRRLAAVLRQQPYDAVVTHMPWIHAIFGSVVRRTGLPLVFWMHNTADGRLTNWIDRWAQLTRPDLVIANSCYTAQTLPLLYPKIPPACEVVHYPVSMPHLFLSLEEKKALRRQFNTPEDAVVIIQVSRMEPFKGHEIHLEALGQLTDVPRWHLWMVGGAQRPHEQRYLDQLKTSASRFRIANRVHFLGERRDIPRLLRAADIFCQPNRDPEAFGIVFIEALQASLPVITTAQGGPLEIVNATCGRTVHPSAVDELAIALRTLIVDADLRHELGKASRPRAQELCVPAESLGRLKRSIECIRCSVKSVMSEQLHPTENHVSCVNRTEPIHTR
jgi:glycosyltransferase involved in cell wall biosynthesis